MVKLSFAEVRKSDREFSNGLDFKSFCSTDVQAFFGMAKFLYRHLVDLALHTLRILKLKSWSLFYTQQPSDRKDFKLDSKRKLNQRGDPYKI